MFYSNSRNINDKIFRGGTEGVPLYKVGPNTIRSNNVDDNELHYQMYNKSQGFDGKQAGSYIMPAAIRKKSMNEKNSKASTK